MKKIYLENDGKVVENAMVAKDHLPLQVRLLRASSGFNELEIYNSSDELLNDIRAQIVGPSAFDCFWDPYYDNRQLLSIGYLLPGCQHRCSVVYADSPGACVDFHFTWKNTEGRTHSQIVPVRLFGCTE